MFPRVKVKQQLYEQPAARGRFRTSARLEFFLIFWIRQHRLPKRVRVPGLELNYTRSVPTPIQQSALFFKDLQHSCLLLFDGHVPSQADAGQKMFVVRWPDRLQFDELHFFFKRPI